MKKDKFYIYGKKVVIEALQRGEKLQKIYIQHGIGKEDYRMLEKSARKNGIPLTQIDKHKMEKMVKGKNHQGVAGLLNFENIIDQNEFSALVEKLASQQERITLLYLDRIQDPQNFGALLRSAEIFGIDAVLFPIKDSVPITPVVIKASMGAALMLNLVTVKTPFNFLSSLKEKGFSLIGALKEEHISVPSQDFIFPEKSCLIIGNEENGIKNSLRKICDHFVHIDQKGKTESLNASVAGGILLYERMRQFTDK